MGQRGAVVSHAKRLLLAILHEPGGLSVDFEEDFIESQDEGFKERYDGLQVLCCGEGIERAGWAVDERGERGGGCAE